MRFTRKVGGGLALLVALSAPAAAQNGFVWRYDRQADPDPLQTRLTLSYAVPETDAVQFVARCEASASLTFAAIEIGLDVAGLAERAQIRVNFTADGVARQTVLGTVVGTRRDEGIVGASIPLDLTDPLWQTIRERLELTYAVDGGRPSSRLVLAGSRQPTRQFLDDCQELGELAAAPPAAPTPPEPTPVVAPTPAPVLDPLQLAGQTLSCEALSSLKSVGGGAAAAVTFDNASKAFRVVMWVDGDGAPQTYASLNDGQSYTQPTFVGHPWLITDGPGNCLGIYLPSEGETTVTINPLPPGAALPE